MIFLIFNGLRPVISPLKPLEQRLTHIGRILALLNLIELRRQPLEVFRANDLVDVVAICKLLSKRVRLWELDPIIKETRVNLLDPWLVLVRLPILLQVRRRARALVKLWLEALSG